MEIFSYQRSFPTRCFRLKGKIRLIVTVMLGKVTAIEESRVVWFILIVPEIVNMVGGKYTTCDEHEHPHFYIQMTKAKVRPKKNIVTEIVNGLFGKRFVTLMDELFVFWFTSAYPFAFGYKLF